MIWEVKYIAPPELLNKKKKKGETDIAHVGSIAAGGRYDRLTATFSKKAVPCVGISFGVERLFTILKTRQEVEAVKTRSIDAYVMAFGGKEFDGLLPARLSILSQLWDANIRAEFTAKLKPKLPAQFKAAETVGKFFLSVKLSTNRIQVLHSQSLLQRVNLLKAKS
jgi:histidyl-tRNA synthetase